MSAVLHVWDLAHAESRYACNVSPGQPAVCVIVSSRHLPDARRLARTSQRICRNCLRIVQARIARSGRGR
jgi:hypothetical protein